MTAYCRPAVVIAASGIRAGGRIKNYLKALLPDKRTDVIFVGYQAKGTPGRDIQRYRARQNTKQAYVMLDCEWININAAIYTLSGYSAHADQQDLINFFAGIKQVPQYIRIVHGDDQAKEALQALYREQMPGCDVGEE